MASTDYSLRRSRLPGVRGGTRREFLLVAAALFVMLMGSNMATPLYAVYRQHYGFSAVVLTLIFAVYATVLVPSLLFFGQLSDRFGRRPVMAAGLVGGAAGLALFAFADGTAWLFAARAVQALGTGLMSAAAAAALVELEPGGDRGRAAVATVLGNNGGSAAGPLVAGMLAQWAPDPLMLCYLTGIACLGFALLGVLSIRDPVVAGGRWRPQRPSVPGPIRVRFARASLTGASVWGVGGLFLSVVPSYAGQLLHTGDLALLGAIAGLTLGASCVAQLVVLRGAVPPRVAQPAGLMLVVAGVGLLIAAFPLGSLPCLLASAAVAGFGNGTALFGAQAEINVLAPGERRGAVTAAFIACLYGGVAVTAVGAGLLADAYGLSTAVAVIGAIVAGVATMTALWHLAARRSALAEQEVPR
jgi:MFS family permease